MSPLPQRAVQPKQRPHVIAQCCVCERESAVDADFVVLKQRHTMRCELRVSAPLLIACPYLQVEARKRAVQDHAFCNPHHAGGL